MYNNNIKNILTFVPLAMMQQVATANFVLGDEEQLKLMADNNGSFEMNGKVPVTIEFDYEFHELDYFY